MIKYIVIAAAFLLISPVLSAQTTAYHSQMVSFKSGEGAVTFAGTLTLPDAVGEVPAIVIVSGAGKQDRDGNMAGHPLFAQIAAYLSENGFAVLRLDDRGTGRTTGIAESETVNELADDALLALKYLKGVPGINDKKIGLLGHGEGGAAIAVAAGKSKDVAFLISIAGMATSGVNAGMGYYDPAKTLKKVQVPILALHGDRDLVIPAEQHLDNWKNYSANGGNRKVRTVLLSGLNHLFLPCRECTVAEYPKIRSGFSNRALGIITRWLQNNI